MKKYGWLIATVIVLVFWLTPSGCGSTSSNKNQTAAAAPPTHERLELVSEIGSSSSTFQIVRDNQLNTEFLVVDRIQGGVSVVQISHSTEYQMDHRLP